MEKVTPGDDAVGTCLLLDGNLPNDGLEGAVVVPPPIEEPPPLIEGGDWAMWATPAVCGATSIDNKVVGLVLAAPERAVFGSDKYPPDVYDEMVWWVDLEGAGDGGEVGGRGRMEASSSASGGFDQFDPGAAMESDKEVDRGDGGSES